MARSLKVHYLARYGDIAALPIKHEGAAGLHNSSWRDPAEDDTATDQDDRKLRRSVIAGALVGALGLAGLVLAGCGTDPNDAFAGLMPRGVAPSGGSGVDGSLYEWQVRADVDTVHAGPVTFTFENKGTIIHEMLVTRTDLAPGKIPVDLATEKFNEDDPASTVLDEISEFDPGKTGSVTLNLTP